MLIVLLPACSRKGQTEGATIQNSPALLPFDERPAEDDIIYFLVTDRFDNGDPENDRGGLSGGRLQNGFDPEDESFYHGGDLQGVRRRLDYLAELGVTAIWITPVFRNLPLQQFGPWLTASYHGYWISDFTSVDPHLGSADDLRQLIDAAHERDIKVILDIVVNHTADVIKYRECHDPDYSGPGSEGPAEACVYRTTVDYPDHAYTPYIDEQYLHLKSPAWLNDPAYYHNRGELDYTGESFYQGDFSGLDDLFTENPRVLQGMIDIYQYWIREFGIDGYRIDTAGHVNTSFFSQFAPALQEYAANRRPAFFMFGEVVDTTLKKRSYIAEGKLPAILDFDFQHAVVDYVADSGSARHLAEFFDDGDYFIDGDTSPYRLPTFLGNHDLGRFGVFLKKASPDANDEINLQRSTLAHAILFFSRGIPILYYGDEQGFMTDPGFHESREDMFPSVTASYNDNDLIGTDSTTANANFDRGHPLYRRIRELAAIYRQHVALRRGDQIERFAAEGPGLFAFSRIDPDERIEYLVLVNNALNAASAVVPVATTAADWEPIAGTVSNFQQHDDQVTVTVAPLGYAVYRADRAIPLRVAATAPDFTGFNDGDTLDCSGFIEVSSGNALTHIEFAVTTGDGKWQILGVDREPPFRTYLDLEQYEPDSDIVLRARSAAYSTDSAATKLKIHLGTRTELCQ